MTMDLGVERRSADMELHWALWNLGEPVSLRAEMDEPAPAPR